MALEINTEELYKSLRLERKDSAVEAEVEDCGEYYDELADYCITFEYTEESDACIAAMFNQLKLPQIVQLYQNDIKTFFKSFFEGECLTDAYIERAGGLQTVLESITVPEEEPTPEEPEPTLEDELPDEVTTEEPIETTEEQSAEPADVAPAEEVTADASNTETEQETVGEAEALENADAANENEVQENFEMGANQSAVLSEEGIKKIEDLVTRLDQCVSLLTDKYDDVKAVFNSDGSFKGFSERNFVEIADSIRKLDDSVDLGDISSEDVLTEEEIKSIANEMDVFAPSLFKQFVINLCTTAESERDRLYVSNLLTKFVEYKKEVM